MTRRLLFFIFSLFFFSCAKEVIEPQLIQIPKFTLKVTTSDGGKVDNVGGEFIKGTILKISATANQDYKFKEWIGDKPSTDNPLNLSINDNYSIQANFISNCKFEKVITKNWISNSYNLRKLYFPQNMYEALQNVDPKHTDNLIDYGLKSISVDYNSDGYLDFISYRVDYAIENFTSPIKFYLSDCNGILTYDKTNSNKFDGLVHGSKILTGDYNGDGYVDLFFVGQGWDKPPFPGESPIMLLGSKDATFSIKKFNEFKSAFHSTASGDLDKDGDLDLILTSGKDFTYFLLNDGKGNFNNNDNLISKNNRGSSRYTTEIFDINNDGFEDILVAGGEKIDYTIANKFEDSPPIIYYGPNYNSNIKILPKLNFSFGSSIQNGFLQQNISTTLDVGFYDIDNDSVKEIFILRAGNNYQGWHIQILKQSNNEFLDVTSKFIDDNYSDTLYPFSRMYFDDFDNDGKIEIKSEWEESRSFKTKLYYNWELEGGKFKRIK